MLNVRQALDPGADVPITHDVPWFRLLVPGVPARLEFFGATPTQSIVHVALRQNTGFFSRVS